MLRWPEAVSGLHDYDKDVNKVIDTGMAKYGQGLCNMVSAAQQKMQVARFYVQNTYQCKLHGKACSRSSSSSVYKMSLELEPNVNDTVKPSADRAR